MFQSILESEHTVLVVFEGAMEGIDDCKFEVLRIGWIALGAGALQNLGGAGGEVAKVDSENRL